VTEVKIFEPITTQAEFDERLKTRLAREKEKWEKQSGVENLKAQLNTKAQEIADLKNSYYLEDARRAVVGELASRGVTDEERIQRVMKLIDLEGIEPDQDGAPARGAVLSQLDSVASDVPELVRPRGAGSGGSRHPVLKTDEPLSREEVENMSPEQVNSNWDRVQRFLRGERG
jgi:hypothetical protein